MSGNPDYKKAMAITNIGLLASVASLGHSFHACKKKV